MVNLMQGDITQLKQPKNPTDPDGQPELADLKELLQQALVCQFRRHDQLQSLKLEVARLRSVRTGNTDLA
jgi:hypothetical protein